MLLEDRVNVYAVEMQELEAESELELASQRAELNQWLTDNPDIGEEAPPSEWELAEMALNALRASALSAVEYGAERCLHSLGGVSMLMDMIGCDASDPAVCQSIVKTWRASILFLLRHTLTERCPEAAGWNIGAGLSRFWVEPPRPSTLPTLTPAIVPLTATPAEEEEEKDLDQEVREREEKRREQDYEDGERWDGQSRAGKAQEVGAA